MHPAVADSSTTGCILVTAAIFIEVTLFLSKRNQVFTSMPRHTKLSLEVTICRHCHRYVHLLEQKEGQRQ